MSYNEDSKMYEGYIYKVTNLVNEHAYIGQTMRTIGIRWQEHIKDALAEVDDYYFHRAIRLYQPDNFNVEQIMMVCAESLSQLKYDLNQAEKYFIDFYDTYNPNGYNGTSGGEGRFVGAIDYYSLEKEFICRFNSMTEASEQTGLSMTSIFENCNGVSTGTRCGFFRYKDEQLDKFETLYRYNGAIKINKFDLDGKLIKSYKSCREISDEYGTTAVPPVCQYIFPELYSSHIARTRYDKYEQSVHR